jgi:signal peptidase I
MEKIKEFFKNRWVKFSAVALIYTLLAVVWTGNLWMLLGLAVIYDIYISKLFYRYVWCHNAELRKRSAAYNFIYEWVSAIIFATVAATLIHILVFQLYVIPTSSMEKSLLIGDYLYVSKLAYGPQMPNTPLSFPFVHHTMPWSQSKKSFSEAIKWPYHRLKGLGKVERDDVVVFNFPAGDTVLLENQAVTYYDVLRQYTDELGEEAGRARLNRDYTIISRPVDKRENYTVYGSFRLVKYARFLIDEYYPDYEKLTMAHAEALADGDKNVIAKAESDIDKFVARFFAFDLK